MEHMQVDKHWWAEAVNTTIFITNRLPCAAIPDKTPFEICFGEKPEIGHFRVFGAKGFAHIDKSKRSKFESKADPCVFLGYSDTTKGYRVWNVKSKKVEVVRSVRFQEVPKTAIVQVVHQVEPRVVISNDDVAEARVQPTSRPSPPPTDNANNDMDSDEDMFMNPNDEEEKEEDPVGEPVPDPLFDIDDVYMEEGIPNLDTTDLVPRGRIDHPSPVFAPSTGSMLPPSDDVRAIVPVERSEALVPRGRFDSSDSEDGSDSDRPAPKRYRLTYEEAHATLEVPVSYKQALSTPEKQQWIIAIQYELNSLEAKKTWTLVNRNPSLKVIGSKWVFALKRDEEGNIQRYKARLVALGYRQTQGIDRLFRDVLSGCEHELDPNVSGNVLSEGLLHSAIRCRYRVPQREARRRHLYVAAGGYCCQQEPSVQAETEVCMV